MHLYWSAIGADDGTDTRGAKNSRASGKTDEPMKISYDPQVDALYISFKKGPTQVTTIRLNEDVAIDLGPGEEVVGIEVLDASQHVSIDRKAPKVVLENLRQA